MAVELAIRQWARTDELAANAVASVDLQTVAASMSAPELFIIAADLTKMQVLADGDGASEAAVELIDARYGAGDERAGGKR